MLSQQQLQKLIMDAHNVTEENRELINKHKKALQDAKERQGKRPRDRDSIVKAYSKFILALRSCQDNKGCNIVDSPFLPPAYLPCTSPATHLSPIAIKDLQLEKHHRGAYIVLRSVALPHRTTAIMALMEDENPDAILLYLYQQEAEDTRAADKIITDGTILLVKEPYFKLMDDGEYGIRVDHPSDIIHLKHGDHRIPGAWQPKMVGNQSAGSLQIQGNIHMVEKNYWDALEK